MLDERLRFIPDRYARTYQAWIENLRDWPISRQLWWGHQIPVWSCSGQEINRAEAANFDTKINEWRSEGRLETGGRSLEDHYGDAYDGSEGLYFICVRDPLGEDTEIVEFLEKPGYGFQRDDDVLDTWFSSALWPFSTLGWPDESADLSKFYPGHVLCTAREIITLWVSRMVMMGQYCCGDIPFSDVFIHAMIQDGQGRKMSKSLGNGIDPLDIVDSHGGDAMRFTLASMTTLTQDVRMPVESMELPDGRTANTSPKFDNGRNFCNKLWNASRFALTNLENTPTGPFDASQLRLEDRWILSRLAETATTVSNQLDEFKFSEPINLLYRFFWNDLCDWYLELIKPRMRDDAARGTAQRILAFVLDACLRLLHPFLPFITEGIYQQLNALCPQRDLDGFVSLGPSEQLIAAAWPQGLGHLLDPDAESQMLSVQSVVRLVRDIRTRHQIAPRQGLAVAVKTVAANCRVLLDQQQLIGGIAFLDSLQAAPDLAKPADAAAAVSDNLEVYVAGVIDADEERKRLLKQKEQFAQGVAGARAKLDNENFVSRARPEIVERERQRLAQLEEQLAAVEKNLSDLGS